MPYEPIPIMLSKAKRTMSNLQQSIYEPVSALTVTAWVTKEPVPFEDRESGRRIRLQPGDQWGELWDCAWFHFEGVVPDEAKGRKVVLLIDVNGELCLVDHEGTPLQGLTNVTSEFDYTLGRPGKRVVDVSPAARGGEAIDLWADAGCNDLFGRFHGGTLKEAVIAVCHEDIRRLYYDFEVLVDLAEQLPDTSARKAQICQSLYEASNLLSVIDAERAREAAGRLADELAGDGWRTLPFYDHDPAFLRVWHPDLDCFGLSIGVLPARTGTAGEAVWWYVSLPHVRLAPCEDVSGAVGQIALLLGPWVMAARSEQAAR